MDMLQQLFGGQMNQQQIGGLFPGGMQQFSGLQQQFQPFMNLLQQYGKPPPTTPVGQGGEGMPHPGGEKGGKQPLTPSVAPTPTGTEKGKRPTGQSASNPAYPFGGGFNGFPNFASPFDWRQYGSFGQGGWNF